MLKLKIFKEVKEPRILKRCDVYNLSSLKHVPYGERSTWSILKLMEKYQREASRGEHRIVRYQPAQES